MAGNGNPNGRDRAWRINEKSEKGKKKTEEKKFLDEVTRAFGGDDLGGGSYCVFIEYQ